MTAFQTRVSTSNMRREMIEDTRKLQSAVNKGVNQISSGKRLSTYDALSSEGKLEQFNGIEVKLQQIEDYMNNNNTIITRLQSTDLAIKNIIEIANSFGSQLTIRRSSAGKNTQIDNTARNSLAAIEDNLNFNIGGYYVFSGSATNTPAVGDLVKESTIIADALTTSYYMGNQAVITGRVSDALSLTYNVRANEDAFRNVIGAMHRTIDADKANDDSELARAFDELQDGIKALIDLRATVLNNISRVDTVNFSHTASKVFFNEQGAELVSTKVEETMTQLALSQTMLQASYQAYSKASRLSLADYL